MTRAPASVSTTSRTPSRSRSCRSRSQTASCGSPRTSRERVTPPLPLPPQEIRSKRILVAGVGNVLRGDDGFGPAVAELLAGVLPQGAEVIETGTGGIALLQ